MCIRLAHLLRILLVSIKPVQASKAAKETIVYVHTYSMCRLDYVQRSYCNSDYNNTNNSDIPLRYW